MKIFLSNKQRYDMITLFCIELVCIVFFIIYFINNIVLALFMSSLIFLLMKIVEIIIFCSTYRLFTYTINKNGLYESFLFKKSLCIIDKAKPIYYKTFSADEGMYSKKEYIVLSNELFEFQDANSLRLFPWDKKPFLVSYDVKKQIVMPYNQITKSILELEKWYPIDNTKNGSLCYKKK